jgi:hypothetical protein
MRSESDVNVYYWPHDQAGEAGWVPLGVASDWFERSLVADSADGALYERTIERFEGISITRTVRVGQVDPRTYVRLFDRTHPRLRRTHEAYHRRSRARRRRPC